MPEGMIGSRKVDAEEWAARTKLAAAYRAFDHFGWTGLIGNHLTLRISDNPPVFLINPYGLLYTEITASNLIRVDMDGKVLDPTEYPVNPAGFNIHSAIHMGRADAHCVMHVHTVEGAAISALEEGLLPLCLEATDFYDRLSYHDFEGPSLEVDERTRLAADLGSNNAMVLRNHGLITVGETVDAAFLRMFRLMMACKVQLAAFSTGLKVRVPGHAVSELSAQRHAEFFKLGPGGRKVPFASMDFAAAMRLMDRKDPSYRE